MVDGLGGIGVEKFVLFCSNGRLRIGVVDGVGTHTDSTADGLGGWRGQYLVEDIRRVDGDGDGDGDAASCAGGNIKPERKTYGLGS